jgi:hypothetical protein
MGFIGGCLPVVYSTLITIIIFMSAIPLGKKKKAVFVITNMYALVLSSKYTFYS